MTLSLYSVTVPSFEQILGSLRRVLDKGEAFSDEAGLAHDEFIQARLIEDMLPFAYQVKSMAVHFRSARSSACGKGSFAPDFTTPPDSFAALRQRIDETLAGLAALESSRDRGVCRPANAVRDGRL